MELKRLDPGDSRPVFDCGDPDLNEFYARDSIDYAKQLLSVTYLLLNNEGTAIGFLSLSNDAIRREDTNKSRLRRILKPVPHVKRYPSMPAVKIGRFAICKESQSSGLGTQVIDLLKIWFIRGNKTGCRFIVVDAYNNAKTIRFYCKNGFDFLTEDDKEGKTRIMYVDLMPYLNYSLSEEIQITGSTPVVTDCEPVTA
jgi:GNAT superfamily N-acetyltransferase